MVERARDPGGELASVLLERGVQASRCDGGSQHVVPVCVVRHRVEANLAPGVPREQRRDFAVEPDELLDDRRASADGFPSLCQLAQVTDRALTLSVVSRMGTLEHTRKPDSRCRVFQLFDAQHRRPVRLRHSDFVEETTLDATVLDRSEHRRSGPNRQEVLEVREYGCRYMLRIHRDHVCDLRELLRSLHIVELAFNPFVRECHRGLHPVGREDADSVAHPSGLEHHHAGELPAADHSQRRAWKK